ncbi:hypothetical protein AB0L61_39045 [Streptomyces tendae]|uniref:hypothetical protein n=1 Tax=Streptomyces tendae TaxID=1932 RepID=UPI0034226EF4
MSDRTARRSWHRAKHAADRAEGFDHLTQGRLQIAHVRTWPAIKDLCRSYPRLVAERGFHCLDNVALLCPEAHDLYDGAGTFSADMMQMAARLTWTHPGARGSLLQYLRATVEARSGHQTENTNLLMAAEYLRHDHATDVQPIVGAFEARCRTASQALERGDDTKVHREDVAVFSMPRWASQPPA